MKSHDCISSTGNVIVECLMLYCRDLQMLPLMLHVIHLQLHGPFQ